MALKSYRLVFGTPNVYADLGGGDILYLGAHWNKDGELPLFGENGTLYQWVHSEADASYNYYLSDTVLSDLGKVRKLAVHPVCWSHYLAVRFEQYFFPDLRQKLKGFLSLEQLMLVVRDSDDVKGRFSDTPGYTDLKAIIPADDRELYEFFLSKLDPETGKAASMPSIRAATADRVTKVPGEDWEETYGEPYVSYSPGSPRASLTLSISIWTSRSRARI